MAKQKQEEAPKGSPAWMATFSDLMNLLLCFFVLLFSMSSVDAEKYELVVNSLQSAFSILQSGGSQITEGAMVGSGLNQMPDISNYFGDTLKDTDGREVEDGTVTTIVEGGGELEAEDQNQQQTEDEKNLNEQQQEQQQQQSEQAQQQQQSQSMSTADAKELMEQKGLSESEQMAENIEALSTEYGLQDFIEVDFNGQFVRITLNGALLFASGSSDLKLEAIPIVNNIGHMLEDYQESLIEIEGHTDNVPIRSAKFETNEVLSMYRAMTVANRIRGETTINPGHIVSSGRGEFDPIADNSTSEGRSRNRRVEIKIYNSYNSDGI